LKSENAFYDKKVVCMGAIFAWKKIGYTQKKEID
jgi:hypothetical protein